MKSPQDTRGCLELVDSMMTIEFNSDRKLFQAMYDRSQDSVSMAVVALIGTVLDEEPDRLSPLHSSIDTDALELFSESPTAQRGGGRISFDYEGFEVTVFGNGRIEAVPQENA